ncbi:hypothetical protein D3C71_2128840 [compost metagenome]
MARIGELPDRCLDRQLIIEQKALGRNTIDQPVHQDERIAALYQRDVTGDVISRREHN